MHDRTKRTNKAQAFWRQEFGRCVYAGCHGSPLGCHIYGKGGHPEFSDCLYNGIGLCSRHHTEFDNQGKPHKKIDWLLETVDAEFTNRVFHKLQILDTIVQVKKR